MAYIGRDIQYGVLDKQSFTANSSTTAFTLDSGVKNAMSLLVCVGGVVQEPEVAYTASGTTLTFTSAPTTGDIVYAVYLGKELAASTGGRESITFQTGTGDGSNTTPITLSTAPANAQSLMVMLNGVTQVPVTDYTVSGTTLTFTTAPDNGMGILVYHLGKAAAIGTLADNSVTNPKIVTMDAAKLTGSLPSGMGVDSTSIDQTIASLGMHVAVADNKASFNLPGVFIDQFESDSGILTETTVDRNTTGEYVSSIQGGGLDSNHVLVLQSDTTNNSTTFTDISANAHSISNTNVIHSTNVAKIGSTSVYFQNNGKLQLPDHSDFDFGTSDITIEMWVYSSDTGTPNSRMISRGSHPTEWFLRSDSTESESFKANIGGTIYSMNTSSNEWADNAWHHVAVCRDGSTLRLYVDGVQKDSQACGTGTWNASAGQPVSLGTGANAGSSEFFTGYLDGIRISKTCRYPSGTSFTPYTANISSQTVNATGTLISTASTAPSATTTASGVMVYEDSAGTATLGTDLKAYFSANDGANWTEVASYGSTINFNGASKKLVKLGKTTGLTSGTQMKLKAVWANQAAPVAGTQSLIAQNTGTAIGNMTEQGGLAAAFNGNKNQAYAQNAVADNGNGPGYIGKDWGNGNTKKISGVKIWGSNETGYGGTGHATGFFLYGSNSAPTGLTDGTLIATLAASQPDVNSTNPLEYLTGIDTTNAYRYHWFAITTPTNTTGQVILCELEFYETSVAVTGKETRLHGWALNY